MLAVLVAAALSASLDGVAARLERAMRDFAAARPVVQRQVGDGQSIDLGYRLVQDQQNALMRVPGERAADSRDALLHEAALDIQAVEDLARQEPASITLVRTGLYEAFVRSSVDGMLIPTAVYVPANARRGGSFALLLHGSGQSETDLLGSSYFRRLADATGTILVAPWGRGTFDFAGAGRTDVADVLHAAQRVFTPDPRRTYLVGYSMGGYSTFLFGPQLGKWAAVMDVCGAVQGTAAQVAFAWRSTPLYVITGANDIVVPPVYPRQTAATLSLMGVPVSFYEEPAGQHWPATLGSALAQAWTDMQTGVVRSGSVPPLLAQKLPDPPKITNDMRP